MLDLAIEARVSEGWRSAHDGLAVPVVDAPGTDARRLNMAPSG
jgi:hypothetical protein